MKAMLEFLRTGRSDWPLLLVLFLFVSHCVGAPTDSPRDADQAQSGYLDNHNMDPAIVQGSTFGRAFRKRFYAKPLVYTPKTAGSKQVLFVASETNWVYVMDAVTGVTLRSKQVATPFLVSDIGCNDISGFIGITGTPIIDPATDTVYFYAKSYPGAERGVYNGAYWIHALDINNLNDRPGFPKKVDGSVADNDPTRYFHGGTHLQRTSLSMINNIVYAGFGGHCDKYNFTGWVVGVDKTTAEVKATFATESGAFGPQQDGTFEGGGGGAGIWMSGMSISSDSPNRLFYVTGNGEGHQNKEIPASGRTPLDTLDEAIVNMRIDPATGKLSLQDYFEPYEYISMDAGDRDLGSGGIALLDPNTFSGTNAARLGVTVGKNGKAYIVNLDNLGGFKMGPAGSDAVVQTLQMPGGGSVFGGTGSYPLEGGYIYMTPVELLSRLMCMALNVGYPTLVYKFGKDANGRAAFTQVAQTDENSAGRVGVGVPTITTFKGQAGTAILWIADVDGGLRAYRAVPENGKMIRIQLPPTPSVSKFQRPSFGDGRLYLSTSNGYIQCLGSPVALPLNCTSPISFGDLTIGSKRTLQVNCTALIAITKVDGITLSNPLFTASNSSLPTGALVKGQSFSFPVTFDLTNATIKDIPGTSVPSVKPGITSGALNIMTTNGVDKFANLQPIVVSGNLASALPFLAISPVEADFGGIVIGSAAAEAGVPGSMVVQNVGSTDMHITGYGWTLGGLEGGNPEWVNVTENSATNHTVGPSFYAVDLPAVGSTVGPGQSIVINLNFRPYEVGSYHSVFQIWSDGGAQYILLTGVATIEPKAVLEVSTAEGGWNTGDLIDFGPQLAGVSLIRQIRLSNTGGSALTITKSKPPEGAELTATNPTGELSEGLKIPPAGSAVGSVLFQPAVRPVNLAPKSINGTWTLNTDDLTFGVHNVLVQGVILSRQLGPLLPDGTSRYKYLGCYKDTVAGRLLDKNNNLKLNNENVYYDSLRYNGAATTVTTTTAKSTTTTNSTSTSSSGVTTTTSLFSNTTISTSSSSGTVASSTTVTTGSNSTLTTATDSTTSDSTAPTSSSSFTTTTNSNSTSAADSTITDSTSSASSSSSTITINSNSTSTTATDSTTTDLTTSTSSSSSTVDTTATSSSATDADTTSSTSTSTSAQPTYTGPPRYITQYNNYTLQGCWTEATKGRALKSKSLSIANMTVDMCWGMCNQYQYFGLEYSKECYCGDVLQPGSENSTSGALCNLKCGGNSTIYCGGRSRLNLYQFNATLQNSSRVLVGFDLPLAD
ncbi:unnamed protein product [Tuber aestivum]|uniref:WSC domain-containing protein n=1 Tax=Tuber aestivum TaxID=59557 RepID=A0A292PPF9_9PEZI|nr:unnamed protein product [Tuber aestivum]